MKFAVLFTGGKDSVFSLWHCLSQGWEAKRLVTMVSENPESYMYHTPNIGLTSMSARALGIPLVSRKTKGEKEKELEDLKEVLKEIKGIDAVVAGAIASDYQKTRIEAICEELDLKSFAPLWHKDQGLLLSELIGAGFRTIITSVSAGGLDASWLGREIDEKAVKELERVGGLNISGEGGEFETLVLDGPIFGKRIEVEKSEKVWEENSGYLNIKKARLA